MVIHGGARAICACAALLSQQARAQTAATNVTAEELAYAAALGAVTPNLDTAIDTGLGPSTSGIRFLGIAYAPTVGTLFSPPFSAAEVLVVNPNSSTTGSISLPTGFDAQAGSKWSGIAYAPSVDMLFTSPYGAQAVLMINPRTNVTDTTTLSGFSSSNAKWYGVAHCPSVDLLYAAPLLAEAVLIINPRTNSTDTVTMAGLQPLVNKWVGVAYAPSVDLLFAVPARVGAVLMINPRTNVTDDTALGGLSTVGDMWAGVAYVSSVDLLFGAPFDADTVLVINPRTNTTGNIAVAGASVVSGQWFGFTYVEAIDTLFAAPSNADSVLRMNPQTNATDTSLGGLGFAACKWRDFGEVPPGTALFAPPCTVGTILAVRLNVDATVIAPLRQISELSGLIGELVRAELSVQTALSSSHVAQGSTQSAIASASSAVAASIVAQASLQTALDDAGNAVCNRPVCADGTVAQNGTCVPDCPTLERRGVDCAPFCLSAGGTAAPPATEPDPDGGGSESGLLIGVILGILLVIGAAAVVCYRRRAGKRETLDKLARQPQSTAMFMNPLHQSMGASVEATATGDFEEPAAKPLGTTAGPAASHVYETAPGESRPSVVLDDQHYVAASDTTTTYQVFGGGAPERGAQYEVFKAVHPATEDDATA